MSTKQDCSCGCQGVEVSTPQRIHNRPGLGALRYRVGAHGTFLDTMLARLASRRELDGLTERGTDDFSIALLDAWAVVGDVLTFYTERIANEGYLRTATEQWSVEQLGRLVGHKPRPAVASSVFLSYDLEPNQETLIPAGSRTNSVPPPGGAPQTFETAEDIQAKAAWNDLGVRRYYPFDVRPGFAPGLQKILVKGITANLTGGERLVFDYGVAAEPDRAIVVSSEAKNEQGHTVVKLDSYIGGDIETAGLLAQMLKAAAAALAPTTPRTTFSGQINSEYITKLVAEFPQRPEPTTDPVVKLRKVLTFLAPLQEALAVAEGNALAHPDWITAVEAITTNLYDFLVRAFALAGLRPPDEPPVGCECSGGGARLLFDGADECTCEALPENDPTAIVALARLISPLTKEPSRPPAGSSNLGRSVKDAFAPGSDVGAQLITAAEPRLQPTLYKAWRKLELADPAKLNRLFVLRQNTTVFGATYQPAVGSGTGARALPYDPEGASRPEELALSGPYDGITPGSWVLIEDSGRPKTETTPEIPARHFFRKVKAVTQRVVSMDVTINRKAERVSATVTVLTLETAWRAEEESHETIARCTVRFKADELTPLGDPISSDVKGKRIQLGELHSDLRSGRYLIVSGERSDLPRRMRGVRASELVMIGGVQQSADTQPDSRKPTPGSKPLTTLVLAEELAYTYHRDTVRVHGNVVEATQGESRLEVLGSGDASQANQSFPVRGTPITWLPSDTPLGATSTLRVSVSGVRWHEAEAVSLLGPTDRVYLTKSIEGGATSVTFGDGVHGERLPTGPENVQARYRAGAGNAGNVDPDTITQPVSRPRGVSGVNNPIAASGGGDGDGPADARRVTPLRTIALDRLVSVADYESFTKARAGIGKASVRELSDGQRDVVHLTITGIKDARIDPSSRLYRSLVASLSHFGELNLPVTVDSRELKVLVLSAGVKVHPDYEWELVEPKIRENLLHRFGFAARELAEPVYQSEVVSVIQATAGVDYVDVDVFDGVSGRLTPQEIVDLAKDLKTPKVVVPARPARLVDTEHTVKTDAETLTSVAAQYGLDLAGLVELNPRLSSLDLKAQQKLVVARGIAPAQLVIFSPAVRDTLILRRL
ncbi:putative baseplate assembly protein [Allokutzneria sp. A3M-2-11 16]|uniref:putative baseplate assembly protein n=1 Tax=Allokutzneria sp. A3M-2-11 16 TaxID=2962043 RepID=UPI0020B8DB73|nr:putative baseplate assembly protein [Allokutzneria sp. A3M-2-11 16]MCP3804187.1 putative baseplate assembly protein [Allokutzneria sp. A3M-2-11 16]